MQKLEILAKQCFWKLQIDSKWYMTEWMARWLLSRWHCSNKGTKSGQDKHEYEDVALQSPRKKHDKYIVYCPSGIIDTAFHHIDLIDMRNVEFENSKTLNPQQLSAVSFTKTVRENSGFINKFKSGDVCICNCKGKYNNSSCACKKNNNFCSRKFHPGGDQWLNK